MDNNNNSGVNTILIVIILLLIVGFGVWYFRGGFMPAEEQNDAGFNVEVNLPEGDGGQGGEGGGQ